ncbi:sigma-70 family RNA polymerase sigma factor [Gottfriedia solisilvae]|uniref:DNA-directed RNA polymerase sigma-70 factor n=1 Tax=Gottfriedia solisilvae TaxID=1516104 RepID=A0A8J3F0R3_9BACI|nr:sigma-70 family RNA polymerase sigma factor [Gottfriedia solisilvae]GGI16612.1 DNA-directed RNA polymerase sigma-70 factor [Gottfriedia solisilvae]
MKTLKQTNSGRMKPKSFEDCLIQYTPMVKSLIKTLRIYKNYEDYYQVGLVALWHAFEHFKEEKGSFSNHAYTTVRGHLLNEMTKESKYDQRFVVVDSYKEEVHYHDEAFLFEQFMSHLEGVSSLQKQILIDRFYLSKSFSEIAIRCNMPEASVRSSYLYALKRLRKQKTQD